MFRITRSLWLGSFATAERSEQLLERGVTHLLNVSDSPSVAGSAFRDSAWVPLKDYCRIPDGSIIESLEALHRMTREPDAQVYVHCVAGRQRSPTILWLYLIACGVEPIVARDMIESRSPNAVAGYPTLVDARSVALAKDHGARWFLPLERGEVIEPFVAQ